MTIGEFNEVTTRLCNLFSKELNDVQMDFWFKNLKNVDVVTYRRAIGEYAKKNKYMPSISDILDSIKNLKPLEQEQPKEVVPCKACRGTGIVIYHKVIDGREYEYAAQCNCPNAIGLDYDGSKIQDKEHRSNYYLPKAVDVFGLGGAK